MKIIIMMIIIMTIIIIMITIIMITIIIIILIIITIITTTIVIHKGLNQDFENANSNSNISAHPDLATQLLHTYYTNYI